MNDNDLMQTLAREGVIQVAGLLPLLMQFRRDVCFGVKGLDGHYRLANPSMERLLCQGGGDLTSKSESELVPVDLREALERCEQRIRDGAATASEEIELALNGQPGLYLCLKFAILGADQKLQSIAAMICESSAPQIGTALQQRLDSLQHANQKLQQEVVELEEAAGTDKLTGAWNRRRLAEYLLGEMARFERYQHPLSLLILDIDFFKAVNDQHGHGTGDQVLQLLTQLLQSGLRGTDALARWGGEEFVVLCPDTNRATAAMLAERLRELIANARFPVIEQLTISIGVAECGAGESWDEWLQRADEALYRAKAGGRNRVQLAAAANQPDGAADTNDYVLSNFVQLVWRPAYECGDEAIDHGHQLLFADANELLSAILSGQEPEQVDAIVDRLLADLRKHFQDEEAIFVAAAYPDASAHIAMHCQLIEQSLQMAAAYHAGTQGVGDVFKFLAHDVVTKHLLGNDRKFFDHLRRSRVASADAG